MTDILCKILKAIPAEEVISAELIKKVEPFDDYIYGAKIKSVRYELFYTYLQDLIANIRTFDYDDILEINITNKNFGYLNIKAERGRVIISQMNPWITYATIENLGLKVEEHGDIFMFKISLTTTN